MAVDPSFLVASTVGTINHWKERTIVLCCFQFERFLFDFPIVRFQLQSKILDLVFLVRMGLRLTRQALNKGTLGNASHIFLDKARSWCWFARAQHSRVHDFMGYLQELALSVDYQEVAVKTGTSDSVFYSSDDVHSSWYVSHRSGQSDASVKLRRLLRFLCF